VTVPGQNHHGHVDLDQIHSDPVTKEASEEKERIDLNLQRRGMAEKLLKIRQRRRGAE